VTGYLRIVAAGSRFLGVLAASLLLIACVVVFWSVVVRYAFTASTVWQSEFVKYAIVAATLLGSPYVLMIGGHVGVDLFEGRFDRVKRIIQRTLAGAIGLTFCIVLAFGAWRYFLEAWSNGWVTESVWAPPLWAVLAPFPIGIGWLCLQYVAEFYKLWSAKTGEART
jgi:TRAP-type C4-dicarboxylate transport system permease small subunit